MFVFNIYGYSGTNDTRETKVKVQQPSLDRPDGGPAKLVSHGQNEMVCTGCYCSCWRHVCVQACSTPARKHAVL